MLRGLKLFDGLGDISFLGENQSEIAMRLGVIRLELQRLLAFDLGFGPTTCLKQRIGQTIMRLRVIGIEPQRLVIMLDRLRRVAAEKERVA